MGHPVSGSMEKAPKKYPSLKEVSLATLLNKENIQKRNTWSTYLKCFYFHLGLKFVSGQVKIAACLAEKHLIGEINRFN